MQIKGAEDFGECCHAASTEPYFYDSAYVPVKRAYALPVDEYGECILARELHTDSGKYTNKKRPMKWACTTECKPLTEAEVSAVVELKEAFDKPAAYLRLV